MDIIVLIKYIYLNRYRKLSYKDKSILIIFPILLFSIIRTYKMNNDIYSFSCFTIFLFIQNIYIYKREDLNFLKINSKSYIFIILIDYLLINSPLIFISYLYQIPSEILLISIPIIFIFFIFSINNISLKINNISLNTYSINPLINSFFRKYPIIYIVIFIIYIISYFAITENNMNLLKISLSLIIYCITYSINIPENLIFLKFSEISIDKYLLKMINSYISLYLKLVFIPIFFYIVFYFQLNIIYDIIISTFIITIIYLLKYIINNVIMKSIIDFITLGFIFIEMKFYFILIFMIILYIFYKKAIKSLETKILNL